MVYTVDNLPNKYNFTRQQLVEFKIQFDVYDEDGSGTISTSEVVELFNKIGQPISEEQAKEMIRDVDVNNSGDLDFAEFVTMIHKISSGPSETDIRKVMFEQFDENLDGLISVAELQSFFRRAAIESEGQVEVPSEDVLRQMIAEVDGDGDGKITEDEFSALVEACA